MGILAMIFEKGKKGEGIPNVILAVATKGGIIKGSVAVLKTIQTAISIGTGGAGGKEGPIVQIGAAIGSGFGQFLNLSSDRLRILVGCGAAAGLSAAARDEAELQRSVRSGVGRRRTARSTQRHARPRSPVGVDRPARPRMRRRRPRVGIRVPAAARRRSDASRREGHHPPPGLRSLHNGTEGQVLEDSRPLGPRQGLQDSTRSRSLAAVAGSAPCVEHARPPPRLGTGDRSLPVRRADRSRAPIHLGEPHPGRSRLSALRQTPQAQVRPPGLAAVLPRHLHGLVGRSAGGATGTGQPRPTHGKVPRLLLPPPTVSCARSRTLLATALPSRRPGRRDAPVGRGPPTTPLGDRIRTPS